MKRPSLTTSATRILSFRRSHGTGNRIRLRRFLSDVHGTGNRIRLKRFLSDVLQTLNRSNSLRIPLHDDRRTQK